MQALHLSSSSPFIPAEPHALLGGRLLLSFLSYSNRSTDLAFLTAPPPPSLFLNSDGIELTLISGGGFGSCGGGCGGGAPHLLQPLFAHGLETMALIVLATLVLASAKMIFLDLGLLLQAFVRQVAIFLLTSTSSEEHQEQESHSDSEDCELHFVPRHIAFIMDGNRRWAQHQGLVKRSEGHKFGYDKLHESLHWCAQLGIKTVTVYAFSIENFKRPKEEVDTLMNLARDKFLQMLAEDDIVKKHNMRVRVIGNFELLPHFVQDAAVQAIQQSQDNDGVVFNICMPYTSTEEIVAALNRVSRGVNEGHLHSDDINSDLIDRCLLSRHSPPPELIIRTSGETRLSDFLLWQGGSSTMLSFLDVMWPDFSEWDFFKVLWRYQRKLKHLKLSKQCTRAQQQQHSPIILSPPQHSSSSKERVQRFLTHVEEEEEQQMHRLHSTFS